jgi:Laminin G domain
VVRDGPDLDTDDIAHTRTPAGGNRPDAYDVQHMVGGRSARFEPKAGGYPAEMPICEPGPSAPIARSAKTLAALVAAGVLTSLGLAAPAEATAVVASWEFAPTGGVIQDQQAGNNDLTLSGQWTTVAENSSGPGGVLFEAAPAAAGSSVANGAHFNPGTAAFALTVQLRATKDVTSGSPNVAQHGSFNDSGQIKMQLEAGGRIGCRVKGDRAAYLFYHPSASVNDNQWHTVTCSRSGTNLSVTVDGSTFSPAGTEDPGSIAVANAPLRFAQKPSSSSKPDQFIGEIASASYSQ